MLLDHVTGCTCYQDIRTLPDGTVCTTFKEACRRRGLLEDDQESDDCLTEAATCAMPAQLRQLFVTILLFNELCDPLALWNKHKASLAEDFILRARIHRMDSCQDHEEVSNFSDLLLRVGEGNEPHDENNMIHLDHKYVVRGESIADLATAIYCNIKEHFNDRDYITPRIMMFLKMRQLKR